MATRAPSRSPPTVDYLFAFAATTGAVQRHHFDLAYDAYLADDEVRDFIADEQPRRARARSPPASREAIERGLWTPRVELAHDAISRRSSRAKERAT